jgi:hypothetical protein
MTLPSLMTDLGKTNRWPTEEEIELVLRELREGGYEEVGITLVATACTDKRLKKRYAQLMRERNNPLREVAK